ncbi:alpha/beta fold hydrolase [Acidovorax sp. ACV02]|uniref:alpha/beta hydrolase n=1 Tax=Acidovorax sp. ACV02 TaxID=2769310 RepID=UPI00177F23BA|nr:alpha/beta fold hydrolase [Acidovorax sp. ACV02]MBD9408024.1 alpha/beta fold hydrolase [Acidovorax sp. ACV02]
MTTSRRELFKYGSAALAGAGLAACGGGNAAAVDKPAYVLVHGAWHGAWTYQKVIPELAALGHAAIAVDLPGHGLEALFPSSYFGRPLDAQAFATEVSPLAAVTVEQCADRVIAAIDQMRAGGFSKVILVGHSLGGVTITRVAERVPEKLISVVYLTAFMLADGQKALDALLSPEAATAEVLPLLKADPAVVAATRIDFASTERAYLAAAKSAFYGDVSDAAFRAIANLLTPDEPIALSATATAKTVSRWGSVPRHYVKCLLDRAIPPALQQRFIDAADAFTPMNKTIVHPMNTSHSPFISAPKELGALLAQISGY